MDFNILTGVYYYQRGLGRQWDVRRRGLTNSTPVGTFATLRAARAYCEKANAAFVADDAQLAAAAEHVAGLLAKELK